MSKLKLIHTINSRDFFVKKISNVDFRERVFMIFEKDLPFQFSFDYENPRDSSDIVPIFSTSGNTSFAIKKHVEMNESISIRLRSEEECEYHIKAILDKQKLEKQYIEYQNNKILSKMSSKNITKLLSPKQHFHRNHKVS
jgi:hypothetical protein